MRYEQYAPNPSFLCNRSFKNSNSEVSKFAFLCATIFFYMKGKHLQYLHVFVLPAAAIQAFD